MTMLLPPVRDTRALRSRMTGPVLVIGGLAAATVALHFRDPHASGSWGYCPSALLGIYCPGCGSLRAVNDLTNGDFAGALSSNVLLVIVMPLLVWLLGRWSFDAWRGVRRQHEQTWAPRVLAVVIPVFVIYTIARNLPTPWGLWLAP